MRFGFGYDGGAAILGMMVRSYGVAVLSYDIRIATPLFAQLRLPSLLPSACIVSADAQLAAWPLSNPTKGTS